MKVFIADKREKGFFSKNDYHWCDDNEILMFGQFQSENNIKGNEVGMCGIQSRKFTTHIYVKDLDISKDFMLELIKESVERAMECTIDDEGYYKVYLGNDWFTNFNINDIFTELVNKASEFNDGDKVICRGRILSLANNFIEQKV